VKVVDLRAKPEPQGMSEIELALMRPVGVSKIFCLLDVPASSHGVHAEGPTVAYGGEHAARVMAFDLAMTHHRMFARPSLPQELEKNVQLLRHHSLVASCIASLPCFSRL
jgi:hypothetical protein